MRFLVRDVKRQAGEFAEQLAEALETAGEENGPQAYIPMLQEDLRAMERLSEAETYKEICGILSAPMFGRLAAVRGKDVDPEKKEAVSELRNRVKDGVKKMKALYVPEDPERIYGDLLNSREPVLMLLELAEEFTARFQEAKEEKIWWISMIWSTLPWISSLPVPGTTALARRPTSWQGFTRRSWWTSTRTATRSRKR